MIKQLAGWLVLVATLLTQAVTIKVANAQITEPRKLSASLDRYANLEEQLVNRLRAFETIIRTERIDQAAIDRCVPGDGVNRYRPGQEIQNSKREQRSYDYQQSLHGARS